MRLSAERGIANSTPGKGRYGVKYLSYQVRDSLIVYVERRISGSLRCFVARSTLDLLCDQWYEWDPGGTLAMRFSVCRMGAGFGPADNIRVNLAKAMGSLSQREWPCRRVAARRYVWLVAVGGWMSPYAQVVIATSVLTRYSCS